MPPQNDTTIKYLQAINNSLSRLIEQVMSVPPSLEKGEKAEPCKETSLLFACLIPNISRDMWNACLAAERSKQALLESCVTIEVDQTKLPNLYTHMYDLLAQADKELCAAKTLPLTNASQVHVHEKHFLFFGALHD